MLAVHWTPVKNTKTILKNGVTKTKKGLYCFPLTGHKALDRWWLYFFNQCGVRERKKYNGIVFRLTQEDMPAYFGHWIGATTKYHFEKEITSLKELGKQFTETIIWRIGEEIARENGLGNNIHDYKEKDKLYLSLAEAEIGKSPKLLIDKMNSLGFMTFTFEDHQIVLSRSISPDRILKVLPQGNEFGRVLKRQKLDRINNRLTKQYLNENKKGAVIISE